MILVRSPLRITLGGGGTDLPAYARQFGGFCLTASISHYVYVAVLNPFAAGIYLKYSRLEKADTLNDVNHPIIREALRLLHPAPQIEITTLADIPAGTGLGSSSSFTTALLQALSLHQHQRLAPADLAAMACELEIETLQQTIGTQDQYAAAYGGLLAQTICPDGRVQIERLRLSPADRGHLEDHLLLFFTGYARESASSLLAEQATNLADLDAAKCAATLAKAAIEEADWSKFAATLSLRRAKPMSARIRAWLARGEAIGASGKLVGAGGGGFLLFYAPYPDELRGVMREAGLAEVRFRFDSDGTRAL